MTNMKMTILTRKDMENDNSQIESEKITNMKRTNQTHDNSENRKMRQ